ncbi:MAG TPA: pitrilysin family protein [Gemmatimonadales bacterium]|nr:pitrilysin family protein [Gemmatimonadales bacterium]
MIPSTPEGWTVPVESFALANGLRVVLSPDTGAPTVVVAVYYRVGFRSEPRGRSGFAHLFEHLMFQGSANLGKMEFIRLVQANGGILNGSTRCDFTNYFEVLPAHKLETALWAEADRMRSLDISEENLVNQRDVVKNEIQVNVHNQPYGGFPWLDLPQLAFENWANAHDYYGDFHDLDAASLEDARAFFRTYYTPNNAVLVLTGDFDPAEARTFVERHFAGIPRGPEPPPVDCREPRQEAEKRTTRTDPLANRPALAVGWQMPPRGTPAHRAMSLLDQLLLQGDDSRLTRALVKEQGLTGAVEGGINLLGNAFNYDGPMLWTVSLLHDTDRPADAVLAALDGVIAGVREHPVGAAELGRARLKLRSALYDHVGAYFGFGRADLLASLTLFDGDPGRINRLEGEFAGVTPEVVRATAAEWLRPENRTVLVLDPGAAGLP